MHKVFTGISEKKLENYIGNLKKNNKLLLCKIGLSAYENINWITTVEIHKFNRKIKKMNEGEVLSFIKTYLPEPDLEKYGATIDGLLKLSEDTIRLDILLSLMLWFNERYENVIKENIIAKNYDGLFEVMMTFDKYGIMQPKLNPNTPSSIYTENYLNSLWAECDDETKEDLLKKFIIKISSYPI